MLLSTKRGVLVDTRSNSRLLSTGKAILVDIIVCRIRLDRESKNRHPAKRPGACDVRRFERFAPKVSGLTREENRKRMVLEACYAGFPNHTDLKILFSDTTDRQAARAMSVICRIDVIIT